jgi:hypothetical protein
MQIYTEPFAWFSNHAEYIVNKCKRTVTSVPGLYDYEIEIYVPGGDDKYPAFWVRDAIMQCRSGFISNETMQQMLEIILFYQNGKCCKNLEHGLKILPWAIADHIILPGLGNEEFQKTHSPGAVFFPGSYSTDNNQGTGKYGTRPADDCIYEVIDLTKMIIKQYSDNETIAYLDKKINDVSILERLHNGFQSMPVDKVTGLCYNTETDWAACSFHDALHPKGLIAFPSILRFRAAKTMAELYRLCGNTILVKKYLDTANEIANSIIKYLLQGNGWINVATELDKQPDVWSTSMAIFYELLPDKLKLKTCHAMLDAYKDGTSVNYNGYLRHTLIAADVTPGEQVWEHGKAGMIDDQYGTYQGGGYWPQPLGYYTYSLAQIDVSAAQEIACSYIDHTRNAENGGAPFEWINPSITLSQTPSLGRLYGPSVALPLEGFKRLSKLIQQNKGNATNEFR